MKVGKDSLQSMLYLVSATDKASAIALALPTTYYTLQENMNGAIDISKTNMLPDNEFKYPVTVPWSSQLDTVTAWNEVCAQAMELFGLPGNRYMTEANVNDMTWYFKDEKDALLMMLKFSEALV